MAEQIEMFPQPLPSSPPQAPEPPEGTRVRFVASTSRLPNMVHRVFGLRETVTMGLVESIQVERLCVQEYHCTVDLEPRGAVQVSGQGYHFSLEPTATESTWLVLGSSE